MSGGVTHCSPHMLPFDVPTNSLPAQPVIPSLFLVQFCSKVAYWLALRKAYMYVRSEPVALRLGEWASSPPGCFTPCFTPFFAADSDTP